VENEGNIRRFTLTDIKEMVARDEDRTDWARVDAKSEEEIERLADEQDAEDGIPPNWWENAVMVRAGGTAVCVDDAVIDWFRAAGPDFQARINDVLRAHVASHSKT
jgi:uncharacterized protein (DUF4415 family)